MLADITIDGMVEEEFRLAIGTLLREGNADHAAKWLKTRLETVCGSGLPLPGRFLTVTPAEVRITGWDNLASRLERLDAAGSPVTAIGIDLGDPGRIGLAPDETGLMAPCVETRFHTDDAWPFSQCDRAGLMAGYEGGTPRWASTFAEVDNTIGIEGIDDLYGAVRALEPHCRPSGDASDAEHRAYMLGASYIAVLTHIAVREAALEHGLPRPLAVLVGSNGYYPGLDAPVIAAPESITAAPQSRPDPDYAPVQFGQSEPDADFGEAERNHPGLLELRELAEPGADPGQEPATWAPPPQPDHESGTQLRKRIITEESIAQLEASEKRSLFQRLFRRR